MSFAVANWVVLRIVFCVCVSFTFANCVVLQIVSCEWVLRSEFYVSELSSFANCELCVEFSICELSCFANCILRIECCVLSFTFAILNFCGLNFCEFETFANLTFLRNLCWTVDYVNCGLFNFANINFVELLLSLSVCTFDSCYQVWFVISNNVR